MDEPAAAEPRRNSRGPGALILGLVGVVMIAVVVIMVMQRSPAAKREDDRPEGVEITVTAPIPGTPFTVDGAPAGKTPQALKLRGRTRPLRIEGNGMQIEVTPDRSQVINLDPKLRR